MEILVTGGAGYIGSVLTEELLAQGHHVVVLDNLFSGHREAVAEEASFVQADLGDRDALDNIFHEFSIDTVMHLAAVTSVGESVQNPRKYFVNNVAYGVNLLNSMIDSGVKKIVFSSSAAIYGQPEQIPITEDTMANPVNPYGESKLMFERILHWYNQAYGLTSASLRYFNVAGASQRFGSDHDPETLLIPNVIKVALGQSEYLSVFGTDYDTADGTCIRDYIHVVDIARAHVLALQQLQTNTGSRTYNIGNGAGFSVKKVIETARKVTGAEIPVVESPRRPGDPAQLVASAALAERDLGWIPQYAGLETIIKSAWYWQKKHPYGYR